MRRVRDVRVRLKDLILEMMKCTEAVTLCLDILTSKVTRGYLGATVHFVDDEGRMRNVVLGVSL